LRWSPEGRIRAAVAAVAAHPELLDESQRSVLRAVADGPDGVTAVIRVEIATCGRYVVLVIKAPDDGADVEIVMTADECREFCNGLGEAIMRVSERTGVMT
jgi:hypothetical protein